MTLKEKLKEFFEWQDGFRVLDDDTPLYASTSGHTLYELIDMTSSPITIGDLRKFVNDNA